MLEFVLVVPGERVCVLADGIAVLLQVNVYRPLRSLVGPVAGVAGAVAAEHDERL